MSTTNRNSDLTLDEEIELDIMDGVVLKAGALVTTDDDGSRWVECHVRVSSGKAVPLEDIKLELITEPLMHPIKFLE